MEALVKHESGVEVSSPTFDQLGRLAKSFALSGYFDDLKGDINKQVSQAFTKIITGQEFGVPPSAAIRGIHIIKGKPSISAGLMSGLIKKSGKYNYKVIARDEKRCEIACMERINGQWESCGPNVVWTIEKAKRAKLTGNPTWTTYPDRMLFARAISEACATYFPDLLLGNVYTPEELETTQDAVYEDVTPQQEAVIEVEASEVTVEPRSKADSKALTETKDWNEEILKIEAYLAEHEENPEEIYKALDGLSARIKSDHYPATVAKRVQKIVDEWSKVLT